MAAIKHKQAQHSTAVTDICMKNKSLHKTTSTGSSIGQQQQHAVSHGHKSQEPTGLSHQGQNKP